MGCGGHPIDETIAAYEQAQSTYCKCEAVTMQTPSVCEATLANEQGLAMTDAELKCVRATYDEYTDDLSATYRCKKEAAMNWDRCLREANCAAVRTNACGDDFIIATGACPEPPANVWDVLNACFVP